MGAMARRWFHLSEEIADHEAHLDVDRSDRSTAPRRCGIGPDAAAEISPPRATTSPGSPVRLLWPDVRIRPIPAPSGRPTSHRLEKGGRRQANASFPRIVIVRKRLDERAKAYESPTDSRRQRQVRDLPLPQAPICGLAGAFHDTAE